MESAFSVEVRTEGQTALLVVTGELDLASAPQLEAELDRLWSSGAEVVGVDLRGVEFMDSTGLRVLLAAHRTAHERDRRFGLVDGPEQVSKLLGMTGVIETLTVVDEPEELLG